MAKMIELGGDDSEDMGRALSRLFEKAAGKGAGDEGPRGAPMPPDVAALELRKTAERYAKGNPYKQGDLVTPRKGHNITFAGEPHVVLELLPAPVMPSRGRGELAVRYDMRVCCQVGGDIVTFYGESFTYEPYTGPVASAD